MILSFRSSKVQHDHYAVAAAHMELGLLYLDTDRIVAAENALETTKLVDIFTCAGRPSPPAGLPTPVCLTGQ